MPETLDDIRRKLQWAIHLAILAKGRPLVISLFDLHNIYKAPPPGPAAKAAKLMTMVGVTYEKGKVSVV